MANQSEINSTSQNFLEIHDVANDLLILKDGSTALTITVNAMNFGLLAEEEQDAIIYSYAGLLNSLNYPIQIVIKSQTKDVTGYLHLLDEEHAKSTSPTKREWILRYRNFVANLIRERNVLDKKFYVVIPASALEMGLVAPSTVIPGVKQPDLSTVERSVILDKAREILEPKRDHLMSQFGRIGLVARQLTTQEIIQLFYLSYNPEAAEGQQITDTNSYTTPLVGASVSKGGIMNDNQNQPNVTSTQAASGQAPGQESVTITPPTPSTPPQTPSVGATPMPTTSPMSPPDMSSGSAGMMAGTMPTVPNTMASEATSLEDPQAAINNLATEAAGSSTSSSTTSPAATPGPIPTPMPSSTPAEGAVVGGSNPATNTIQPPAENPNTNG